MTVVRNLFLHEPELKKTLIRMFALLEVDPKEAEARDMPARPESVTRAVGRDTVTDSRKEVVSSSLILNSVTSVTGIRLGSVFKRTRPNIVTSTASTTSESMTKVMGKSSLSGVTVSATLMTTISSFVTQPTHAVLSTAMLRIPDWLSLRPHPNKINVNQKGDLKVEVRDGLSRKLSSALPIPLKEHPKETLAAKLHSVQNTLSRDYMSHNHQQNEAAKITEFQWKGALSERPIEPSQGPDVRSEGKGALNGQAAGHERIQPARAHAQVKDSVQEPTSGPRDLMNEAPPITSLAPEAPEPTSGKLPTDIKKETPKKGRVYGHVENDSSARSREMLNQQVGLRRDDDAENAKGTWFLWEVEEREPAVDVQEKELRLELITTPPNLKERASVDQRLVKQPQGGPILDKERGPFEKEEQQKNLSSKGDRNLKGNLAGRANEPRVMGDPFKRGELPVTSSESLVSHPKGIGATAAVFSDIPQISSVYKVENMGTENSVITSNEARVREMPRAPMSESLMLPKGRAGEELAADGFVNKQDPVTIPTSVSLKKETKIDVALASSLLTEAGHKHSITTAQVDDLQTRNAHISRTDTPPPSGTVPPDPVDKQQKKTNQSQVNITVGGNSGSTAAFPQGSLRSKRGSEENHFISAAGSDPLVGLKYVDKELLQKREGQDGVAMVTGHVTEDGHDG